MSTLLIVTVAVLPGLLTLWLVFREMMEIDLQKTERGYPYNDSVDWSDVTMNLWLGFLIAIFWPVTLPVALTRLYIRTHEVKGFDAETFARRFGRLPKKEKA